MNRLEELIFSSKGKVTPQSINQIKKVAHQLGVKQIKLWSIKPEMKMLFKMAKFQSYALLLAGIFILPVTLYQKYQQDNQKLPSLIAFTPFALGVCFAPIFFYNKYTKTLLNQISYNLETNMFNIHKYKYPKIPIKNIEPKNLVYEQTRHGRIKKLTNLYSKDISQIQGIGEWANLQLFKEILKTQKL